MTLCDTRVWPFLAELQPTLPSSMTQIPNFAGGLLAKTQNLRLASTAFKLGREYQCHQPRPFPSTTLIHLKKQHDLSSKSSGNMRNTYHIRLQVNRLTCSFDTQTFRLISIDTSSTICNQVRSPIIAAAGVRSLITKQSSVMSADRLSFAQGPHLGSSSFTFNTVTFACL